MLPVRRSARMVARSGTSVASKASRVAKARAPGPRRQKNRVQVPTLLRRSARIAARSGSTTAVAASGSSTRGASPIQANVYVGPGTEDRVQVPTFMQNEWAHVPDDEENVNIAPIQATVSIGTGPGDRVPVRTMILDHMQPLWADFLEGIDDTHEEDSGMYADDIEEPKDEDLTLSQELALNRGFFDEEKNNWLLETTSETSHEGKHIINILSPTATNIDYDFLNQYVYKTFKPLCDLDAFAESLGVDASEWKRIYTQKIGSSGHLLESFKNFCELPVTTSEATLQTNWTLILGQLSLLLGTVLRGANNTPIMVGGLLARDEYNIVSQTGTNVSDPGTQQWYCAAEAESALSFPTSELWFTSSRAVQVLSTMYSFNCPTFLFTQQQWKVFVEDESRSHIYTYPFDAEEDDNYKATSLTELMSENFLKALTICLLSKHQLAKKNEIIAPRGVLTRSMAKKIQEGLNSDATNKNHAKAQQEVPIPTVVGVTEEGEEIRAPIRVYSREEVGRVQSKIQAMQAEQEITHSVN